MKPRTAMLIFLTAVVLSAQAEETRRAVLFIHDSENEHDTLLDAQLTLELYRQKDEVSYWISDEADGSAQATLATYGLGTKDLPVVLLLDRDVADAKPVLKIPVRRPLGYENNLDRIAEGLQAKFGLTLRKKPPTAPEPQPAAKRAPKPPEPAPDEAAERRELSRKAAALGNMHRQSGHLALAESYYLFALQQDRENGAAAYELARLRLMTRKYRDAVQLFAQAQALDPRYTSPVLFYDDFDDGRLDGWLVQSGTAGVIDGRLVLRSSPTAPGIIGTQGVEPWRAYRLTFSYQDGNLPGLRLAPPSFSCAVRSTREGAYWFRTAGFGAEIFKTQLLGGHYLPRQLFLANAPWNDTNWHERTLEVSSFATGAARLRWEQDGRLVGECSDRGMPYGEGAISFHTESGTARIDEVLVVRVGEG